MITENKALYTDELETMRFAALSILAEEESRNKSNHMIYHTPNSRYTEMMQFDEALEPKELGYGLKADTRKQRQLSCFSYPGCQETNQGERHPGHHL